MSTATEQSIPRPDPTKMYGLLHDLEGNPIETEVRSLKVGIGVPSGKDLHVWINDAGKWVIEVGVYSQGKRQAPQHIFCDTLEETYARYVAARKTAPDRLYPRKIPYFTFLRLEVDGTFWPDFEAIEKHGSMPSEIDIVFLKDDPLDASYQWWTAAALQCEGDGRTARRRLELAKTPDEKQLAKEAADRHEKYFPIIDGCFAYGCGYCKGEKPVCKPHGRLHYQLVHSPAIGGTCTFDTTGFRSIKQLFSCMRQIRRMTGQGESDSGYIAGIPLKMVLRPYKVAPNGKVGIQYSVSLEFRATDAVGLVKELKARAEEFRAAASLQLGPAPLQLAGPSFPDEEVEEEVDAAALSAEFYGDFQGQEEERAEPMANPFKAQTRPAESATEKEAVPAEKSVNGISEAPKPVLVEPSKGRGPRSHAKPVIPATEDSPAVYKTEEGKLTATPQPAATQPQETAKDDRADWLPENLGGAPTPETSPSNAPTSPSDSHLSSSKAADAPPKPADAQPKPTNAVQTPSQRDRLIAIGTELAKLGNREPKAVQKCVQQWIMAFANLTTYKPAPQEAYAVPLDFLESEVKRAGLAILQDPHSMGLTCGAGWNQLIRHIDGWTPEAKALAKKAVLAHLSEDPSLLIELLTMAEEEGPLPDSEMQVFLTVYTITPQAVMQFKEKADQLSISMAELASGGTATEAGILTLLAGGQKSADGTQPELWQE